MDYQNPETIKKILRESKIIAVVGLSDKPDRASHRVAAYLQSNGYKIIPVNPRIEETLGEKSYPDLMSVPDKIDVVDIFRRNEDVPPIVEDAIAIKAKAIWMQEGIENLEAAGKASESGLGVVTNRCMLKEHQIHGG
jgi:predicted CoA-binding protein